MFMLELVNDFYFVIFVKVKKIIKDCELFFGFENQILGLEVMELVLKNFNLGFQKLYKWVQKEFKMLNFENL